MDYLSTQITKAGKEAAFNAGNTGLSLEISHIAFGNQGWSPIIDDPAQSLKSEILRVPILKGEKTGSQIHLTARADGEDNFIIKEVGFFLKDGTLFAVYSSQNALAYKNAGTELILDFYLSLSTVPQNSISVISQNSIDSSLTKELISIVSGNVKIAYVQIKNLQKIISDIIK